MRNQIRTLRPAFSFMEPSLPRLASSLWSRRSGPRFWKIASLALVLGIPTVPVWAQPVAPTRAPNPVATVAATSVASAAPVSQETRPVASATAEAATAEASAVVGAASQTPTASSASKSDSHKSDAHSDASHAKKEGDHDEEPVNIAVYLPLVIVLVLLNGFFVASEFSLVAVRKTRIDQLAAEGSSGAKVVQGALKELDRYIAATQVGITVASLLLGGIGERTFHQMFEPLFEWVPGGLPGGITVGVLAFALAYFVMTALHVVIGELMPKSFALQMTERVALVIAGPMILFARLFAPLIWILNGTGNLLLRALGIHATEGHGSAVHSPEELDLLVSQSHQGGELNDTEAEILHRVVRFSDLTAREVMVPRVEMQALPIEMTLFELRTWVHSRPHSRVPVYTGTRDDVVGVVHLKDLVPYAAKYTNESRGLSDEEREKNDEKKISLMPLVRETLRVPETATVDKLLVDFKRTRQQMAIVIDEFGGTAGLATLGDLLEQVFGEVSDEFDTDAEEIKQQNGRIVMPGRTLIDEVNQRFETGFRQDEADTMAGLVLTALGRPAQVGDEIEINACKIRVEAIDRLRITSLSLALPAGENPPLTDAAPVH
jgi:CBS domain containing-hemolysin-like protein